ncbi:unnamed protein product [Camellia sinensis]
MKASLLSKVLKTERRKHSSSKEEEEEDDDSVRANSEEKEENGVAMDDTDVRGGCRGCDCDSSNHTFSKARQVSPRLSHLSHPPTFLVHRPLLCFPAPRYLLEERAPIDVQRRELHRF